MTRIYLDHAATTPLRPEAREAMLRGFEIWANPSSPHAEGRKARAALEDARARVKGALGWDGEVIFTSGASEALAIGLGRAKAKRRIVSAVEHDAVFRAAPDAEIVGVRPGRGGGLIDEAELGDLLRQSQDRAVVAVQHVNSETGTLQPVGMLAEIVRESGGLLLSDCAQSAGKYPLPDADMIVVSAHKLGGPVGIGALLVRDFAMLEPTGGQERGYRAGTENLPAALGFATALEAAGLPATSMFPVWLDGPKSAYNALENEFERLGGHDVLGGDPAINAIFMPNMAAQTQLIRFDAAGIAVSAGSACSSGSLKPSRVLKAFGVSDEISTNTIRVSFGWTTTPEEVEQFCEAWLAMAREAAERAA
ncbi:MAG TPA: aminotransferase class V-fold PLP-dependent enzyme [Croceibacterium sp.]|nr:aminotransferase class V-fold PLP-dependent enzyme [Croceibacterium sp.]